MIGQLLQQAALPTMQHLGQVTAQLLTDELHQNHDMTAIEILNNNPRWLDNNGVAMGGYAPFKTGGAGSPSNTMSPKIEGVSLFEGGVGKCGLGWGLPPHQVAS